MPAASGTVADAVPGAPGPRVPWIPRLAYALGNASETIVFRTFEVFVLFYYTQVLGLSGTVAGLAILAALVTDAIVDPLVGTYSDSLQSRLGRRHTLMFASVLPTAVLFWLLFSPPEGLRGLALGAWLAITAIGTRVALAFFTIPWQAQVAELSPEPRERVTLAVMRSLVNAVAQGAVVALAFDLYFGATPEYPRGQENPAAYGPFALAFAAALVVVSLLSAAGTWRHLLAIERSSTVKPQRFTPAALLPAWRDMVIGFPDFRRLCLSALLILTAFSAFNAFSLYLGSYFWMLTPDEIKRWQLAFVIGAAITFFVGKPIVDRTRPASVFTIGLGAGTAMFAAPLAARLAGLLPDDGATNLLVLEASNGLAGFFIGLVMITSAVLASEVADDYEAQRGVKATALLFGFVVLAMKLASGLGKLITGVAIDLIRLPAAADAATISAQQQDWLGLACCVSMAGLGTLGVLAFRGYRRPDRGERPAEPAAA